MEVNVKDLTTQIAGVTLKNPVMTASGTFGSGLEYSQYIDINILGALVTKGVSYDPWLGNPTTRIAETYGGMLNAIGLQNPGAEVFINEHLPFLAKYDTKIIVNLCGKTLEDYVKVAEVFSNTSVDMYELNISCPNIKEGGMSFGVDPNMAAKVVYAVKSHLNAPLIVKLSPNVTDITVIAKAVEEAGADAISLINTITASKINIKTRKKVLSTGSGGLSGPCVKPIAIHMVNRVSQVTKLPIIGMGGIFTSDDAIEFIMAGAHAIAVGTANFTNPRATMHILQGINDFMDQNKIQNLKEIRGIV